MYSVKPMLIFNLILKLNSDIMDSDRLLVIDIEITRFNHKTDCILELGIVELDTYNGTNNELLDAQIKENHLSTKHHNIWIFKYGFMTH